MHYTLNAAFICFILLSIQMNRVFLKGNPQSKVHFRLARGAVHPEAKRWTKGVVRYTFSEWHSDNAESDKNKIRDAMRLWSISTCIQFVELSDRDLRRNQRRHKNHYITIKNELFCGTDTIGMASGSQTLYLSTASNCLFRGTILHELGHILGLIHEHQRSDRNENIKLLNRNIIPTEGEAQFEIFPGAKTYDSVYDKRSVMHYEDTFMSRNKNLKTFLTKDSSLVGKVYWKAISFYDAMVINKHYRCAKACKWPENCPRAESYLDKNCKCITKTIFKEKSCVDHWRSKKCRQRKQDGLCHKRAEEMFMNCQRTCEMCHIYPDQVTKKPVFPDHVCKDTKVECTAWALRGECLRNQRYMYQECAASCARCQIYSNWDSTCFNIDANNRCDAWQAVGECQRNSLYMHANCARACRLCQPSIKQGDAVCQDSETSRGKCSDWKAIGFCETRKQSMSRKCAASCGFCQTGVSSTLAPMLLEACTNRQRINYKERVTCRLLNVRGMCQTSQQMMISKGCVQECGWCSSVGGSVTPSAADCQDHLILMEKEKFVVANSTKSTKSPNKCALWSRRGLCGQDSVKRLCQSSCGLCSILTTSQSNV